MKVVITGANGQLGRALSASCPVGVDIAALDRGALDIRDERAIARTLADFDPDWVVNTAAFTAVDRAETDEDTANAINDLAVRSLAAACRASGARLAQISTDFVFDGKAQQPYSPEAQTAPLNVYGRTKLGGEMAALEADGLVLRTAWLHGVNGRNFLKTMLKLMRERDSIGVVADQKGTPTSVDDLAGAVWKLIGRDAAGVHHFTNSGAASWYEFACVIREEATILGLIDGAVAVEPLATADYPAAARRPAWSVLDCSATYAQLGDPAREWQNGVKATLEEIARHG